MHWPKNTVCFKFLGTKKVMGYYVLSGLMGLISFILLFTLVHMYVFVLTVAQLSSGMRFPSGLKSISFDVGSILVDVKILSPWRLMSSSVLQFL